MRGSNPTTNKSSRQFLGGALATLVVGALPFAGGSVLAQGLEIEEIIVTAARREESLLDAAISVTAISGDELAQRGWTR